MTTWDYRPSRLAAIATGAHVGDEIYTGTLADATNATPRRWDELAQRLAARGLVARPTAPFYFEVARTPRPAVAPATCRVCNGEVRWGRCRRCNTRHEHPEVRP